VVCIPGDICRRARFACEMDTICNEWGQCPPSAPVSRDDNFVCRAAAGDCDQDELCDGINFKCPPDAFQPAGTPCTDINGNDSQCLGGKPEKAEDPYMMKPIGGPQGVYHEPKSKYPHGRRLEATTATTRKQAGKTSSSMPDFVVAVQANSADSSARRYKYNPRVCPLAPMGGSDDDDGGYRGKGKHGL
jgi:hypothetical protein